MSGEVDPNGSFVASAAKGVIFFGTPHSASTRASWRTSLFQMQKVPSPKPGQEKLATTPTGSEELIRINIKFTEMARQRRLQILSFYERTLTRTTADRASATIGTLSENLAPIASEHNDLARFVSQSDRAYQTMLAFIRGVLQMCYEPIETEIPESAKDTIMEASKAAERSDTPSIGSLSELDPIEKERRFLSSLRVGWLEDLAVSGDRPGDKSWILESREWNQWLLGDENLWIIGNSGMGKTYLAKSLARELRKPEAQQPNPDLPTSHFVLSYICGARPFQTESQTLIKSLLYQILAMNRSLFKYMYGTPIFPGGEGAFELFRQAFNMALDASKADTTIDIVIDGLNECGEASRPALYGLLSTLDKFPSVRVIITTEPLPDLLPSLCIDLAKHPEYWRRDFKKYIEAQVVELARRRTLPVGFSKEIIEMVLSKTNTYLEAMFTLDLLGKKPTICAMREFLRKLPDSVTLNDLFSATLRAINGAHRNSLIQALYCVVSARTFLTVDTLSAFSATINVGARSYMPSIVDIRENTILNLEEVIRTQKPSLLKIRDGSVVLFHPTLANVLRRPKEISMFTDTLKDHDIKGRFQHVGATHEQVQSIMAEACLKYMIAAFKGRSDPYNFTSYCSHYWHEHTCAADTECSGEVEKLVAELLVSSSESEELYSIWLSELENLQERPFHLLPSSNDPASVLSALNLCQVLARRLSIPISSFGVVDSRGYLPLHYAAANNAVQSARWILGEYKCLGGDKVKGLVTRIANDSHCPVHLAVRWGYSDMVDLLLDTIDYDQGLILSLAELADKERQRSVLATLWRRASSSPAYLTPDLRETLLSYAVSLNDEQTTRDLLDDQTAVDADRANLHRAIEGRSIDIVNMLIVRGVDVEAKDRSGSSPLHVAARVGDDDIVDILLNAGARVNKFDDFGRTPLHVASLKGFIRTCSKLLDHGSSVNFIDIKGRLAAHYAASIGHDKLLGLLLRNGSDTQIADINGQTLLHLAARNGHVTVVAMLLDSKDVDIDVNARDSEGKSALHWAVATGNTDIASALLIAGARVNVPDKAGLTPLHIAASDSSGGVVNELLSYGADINNRDKHGRTALHHVCSSRFPSDAALQILLNSGADVHMADVDKRTPLHYAAQNGYIPGVLLLMDNGAKEDVRDSKGLAPRDLLKDNKPTAREVQQMLSV
ncbi:hypothetical protein GP486_002693 [Trichoglossum hirsutum]|uniref:NACHT domain-containing protein n=1 Tax=Trichoglossum hirsutum TaxID=265104 RepID=A0A9P8RRG9_9PEZI|nr:hypothetical protein GP486_002693 [Trichoglossum hirsutum]